MRIARDWRLLAASINWGHLLWAQDARDAVMGVLRIRGWSRVQAGASTCARKRTAGPQPARLLCLASASVCAAGGLGTDEYAQDRVDRAAGREAGTPPWRVAAAAFGRSRNCRSARAPCTNNVRKYPFPCLLMSSNFCLPPVECSRGTKPTHAANSRSLRKAVPFRTAPMTFPDPWDNAASHPKGYRILDGFTVWRRCMVWVKSVSKRATPANRCPPSTSSAS